MTEYVRRGKRGGVRGGIKEVTARSVGRTISVECINERMESCFRRE